MNRKHQSYKKQAGFNLIELLGVIAVIAFLLIVVLSKIGQANDKATVERERGRVLTIKNAIQDIYASRSNYQGLNNQVLLAGTSLTADMRASAGEIRNAWRDNGYVITPSGGNNTYSITSSGVPDEFCFDIVNAINPSNVEFESLTVNGGLVNNPTDARSRCQSTSNTITWIGRR